MSTEAVQTIVITGASKGIGRELAIQLAGRGRKLWLIARDRDRLDSVATEVRGRGGEAEVLRLDLHDLEAADVALRENFPPEMKVDWVYLCAAITGFGKVQDMLPGDWDRIYRIDLLSPVQMCQYFYSNMITQGSGHIVLISSLAAYAGYPTATPYATMKAGLLGLYRSIRHEGKAHGISIHHASLGYVGTDIYRTAIYRKTDYGRTMESIRKMGFAILSAADAAAGIIMAVEKGKHEFALPAYASALKWVSPRIPFVISMIHAKIMRIHRQLS